jgi:biopolymer transport protein TolR
MAIHVGTGTDGEDESVLSDINVTPLVDVMLVLLVIFMITAPMLHQGIEVALPQAKAQNLPAQNQDPLILSITRDGMTYIRDEPVHETKLVERIKSELAGRRDQTVFIKGDRDVSYVTVVEVLDRLREGGVVQIGMITEASRRQRRRR